MATKAKVIAKLSALLEALKGDDSEKMSVALKDALFASYEPYDSELDIETITKAEGLFGNLEEFYNVPLTRDNANHVMPIVHSLLKTLDKNYVG